MPAVMRSDAYMQYPSVALGLEARDSGFPHGRTWDVPGQQLLLAAVQVEGKSSTSDHGSQSAGMTSGGME